MGGHAFHRHYRYPAIKRSCYHSVWYLGSFPTSNHSVRHNLEEKCSRRWTNGNRSYISIIAEICITSHIETIDLHMYVSFVTGGCVNTNAVHEQADVDEAPIRPNTYWTEIHREQDNIRGEHREEV